MFVPLREVPHAIDGFLRHLERSKDKTEPKQMEKFLNELSPDTG
jgi:hypothetical protein